MESPDKSRKSIDQLFAEVTPIVEAVQAGARDALRRHRLLGQPAPTWRDGKVVWVSPDEVTVEE